MSKDPTITALVVTGRLRAHYTYPNGDQMMEEYDEQSNQILLRRTMKKSTLGGKGKWQYEIGEPSSTFQPDTDLLKPSQSKNVNYKSLKITYNTQPIFIRKDSKKNFEWRIRNLPYPKDTYIIQIDHLKQQIVIKTTVKKYYKRFGIAALQNLGIKIDEQNIKWKYANNTLIVQVISRQYQSKIFQYIKPQQIIVQQQATITKLRQIAAHGTGDFGASATSVSEGGEQNKCAAQ